MVEHWWVCLCVRAAVRRALLCRGSCGRIAASICNASSSLCVLPVFCV